MAKEKHPGGRPEKYNPKFSPKLAKALAAQGLTDEQIAEEMEISTATLYNWRNKYPEFLEALISGKEGPDEAVERALFQRATGYVNKNAVKIFMPANAKEAVVVKYEEHLPPETLAGIYWLNNRRPGRWSNKQQLKLEGETGLNISYSQETDDSNVELHSKGRNEPEAT